MNAWGASAKNESVKSQENGTVMIGRRVVLSVALMFVVLAGSAVAVAAQSEAAVPASFSGWVRPSNDDCGEGPTFEIVEKVEQVRGYRCEQWMGTSDPRFTGTCLTVRNADSYRGEDVAPSGGSFGVSRVVRRIENDEGTWVADATTGAWGEGLFEDGEVVFSGETVLFTGEGAYEGLTAVVWLQPQRIQSPVRGVIFADAPPPVPSLADPAVADQPAATAAPT